MQHALTVLQPWADAIFGPKRYENRSWGTSYRGPLLIHAGRSRRLMQSGSEFLYSLGLLVPDESDLAFGALVGRVELVDCLPIEKIQRMDPFAEGPYCFVLEKPRRLLKPILLRGYQGFFGVPDEVLAGAEWEPERI